MKLLSFQRIGQHRSNSRLFFDSCRLSAFGFVPGTPVTLAHGNRSVILRPSLTAIGDYTVSHRRTGGGLTPVLDINSDVSLAPIAGFCEAKVCATQGNIVITPSVRAFHIRKAKLAEPPYRVMEFFCGGGTLSQAFGNDHRFVVSAGMELESIYADCWQATHPNATMIQADIRMVNPCEVPDHEIVAAGIPCADHSAAGRAKKSLRGRPEVGELGDLFIHVLAHVQHRMPLACLFENVPAYAQSLAGETLKSNLRHLGYHVTEIITAPNSEWDEPSDRRRWICVATLLPGFKIESPNLPFAGKASDYLDAPNPELDRADAARISVAVAGLIRHNDRHSALGHRFGFTVLDGTETNIPTITKFYHKVSRGPFVQTPYGPRLLRKGEIERIQGCKIPTTHYTTAVQILGQGVQTRLFTRVIKQLGDFLVAPAAPAPIVQSDDPQLDLQFAS